MEKGTARKSDRTVENHFRPALEIHNRDNVRVIQTREFYSKNGIGLGRVFGVILQQYRCW